MSAPPCSCESFVVDLLHTCDRRHALTSQSIRQAIPLSNEEVEAATVNFSVPEDEKKKFDRACAGHNKSRVIADLMAQAVEEQLTLKRRNEAIDSPLSQHRTKRPVAARAIRRVLEIGY